jgi:hypothetical protein
MAGGGREGNREECPVRLLHCAASSAGSHDFVIQARVVAIFISPYFYLPS